DLVDDYGRALPTAVRHGRRYVLGDRGARYRIRIRNPSGRRAELVVSVDGLDVVDGRPASMAKRGYVINPGAEAIIDGWRTALHDVAAFLLGSVADSYAGRTAGSRHVGVIGVALFAEREYPQPPPLVGPSEMPAPPQKSAEAAPAPGGAVAPRAPQAETSRPG